MRVCVRVRSGSPAGCSYNQSLLPSLSEEEKAELDVAAAAAAKSAEQAEKEVCMLRSAYCVWAMLSRRAALRLVACDVCVCFTHAPAERAAAEILSQSSSARPDPSFPDSAQ
jgi:hypothetical protein